MFKPELYTRSNSVPKVDAVESLTKYASKIKWTDGEAVIDLGCGDGVLTTDVLKQYLHINFSRLLGCDVSENMVKFANKNRSDKRISFKVFDLGGSMPDGLAAGFNHVFSFYAIHWIGNQERVFRNIYELLKVGGDCLLVFPASTPVHDFYRALARRPRWQRWLSDVNNYISPYHDSLAPEKQVRGLMAEIGFNNIEVTCTDKSYVNDLDLFKITMEAINPFKIPSELQKQFMEDYMEVVEDMKLVDLVGEELQVKVDYRLLVVYGTK